MEGESDSNVFVAVFLGVLLVPWTFLKLRALRTALVSERAPLGGGAYAEAVARKASALRSERWRASLSVGTLVYGALVCTMALTCSKLLDGASSLSLPMQPYEVLGIPEGSSREVIRAAYRQLSLVYHPDKAGPDPVAARKFLEITRAHAILTDARARRNYERYGHPDGYQGMSVNIGLPKWMTGGQGEDSSALAALCALALVVAVPLALTRFLAPSPRERALRAIKEELLAAADEQEAQQEAHQEEGAEGEEDESEGGGAGGRQPSLGLAGGSGMRAMSQQQVLTALARGALGLPGARARLGAPTALAAAAALLADVSPAALSPSTAAWLRAELAAGGPDAPAAVALVLLHAHAQRLLLPAALRGCHGWLLPQLCLVGEVLAALALAQDVAAARGAAGKGASAKGAGKRAHPTAKYESVLRLLQRLTQALPPCAAAAASAGGGAAGRRLEAEAEVAALCQLPHVDAEIAARLLAAAREPAQANAEAGGAEADWVEVAAPLDAAPTAASGTGGHGDGGGGTHARKRKGKGGKGGKEAGGQGEPRAPKGEQPQPQPATPAPAAALTSVRALSEAAPEAARTALRRCGLSAAQADDALAFLALFPRPQLQLSAEVVGEERIEVADVVRVSVSVCAARAQGASRRTAGGAPVAHAPWVPAEVAESFCVQLLSGGEVRDVRSVQLRPASEEEAAQLRRGGVRLPEGAACEVATAEWHIKAPSTAGWWSLEVRAVCSCYVGADGALQVPVLVHKQSSS